MTCGTIGKSTSTGGQGNVAHVWPFFKTRFLRPYSLPKNTGAHGLYSLAMILVDTKQALFISYILSSFVVTLYEQIKTLHTRKYSQNTEYRRCILHKILRNLDPHYTSAFQVFFKGLVCGGFNFLILEPLLLAFFAFFKPWS